MAKVMRKEARHTQKWDRASGVPLEILDTPCFNLHMAGGGCSGLLSSAPTADWQGLLLPLSLFQGRPRAAVGATLWCSGQHCPPGTRICGLLPSCVFI